MPSGLSSLDTTLPSAPRISPCLAPLRPTSRQLASSSYSPTLTEGKSSTHLCALVHPQENVDDDEDVLYGSMDMSVPGVLEPIPVDRESSFYTRRPRTLIFVFHFTLHVLPVQCRAAIRCSY